MAASLARSTWNRLSARLHTALDGLDLQAQGIDVAALDAEGRRRAVGLLVALQEKCVELQARIAAVGS